MKEKTRDLTDKEVLDLTFEFQEKMIGLLEEGRISQGQYELFVVTPIYHNFAEYRQYNDLLPITPYVAEIKGDHIILEDRQIGFPIYRFERIDDGWYRHDPNPKSIQEVEEAYEERSLKRDRAWLNYRLEVMKKQELQSKRQEDTINYDNEGCKA